MPKTQNKRKREIRAILLIITGLFILAALFTTITFLQHSGDKKKFDKLSTIMQDLNTTLRTHTENNQLKYKEACEDTYAGGFKSGSILCTITLSLEMMPSTPKKLAEVHSTYYRSILANTELIPDSQVDLQPTNLFGKSFVVSSVEQKFKIPTLTGIKCVYRTQLVQNDETSQNFALGTPISGDGRILLKFECTDKAKDYWYERI